MQTFKDSTTNQYWQFDDADDVRLINGVYQVFDVNGNRITAVPETLVPATLPAPVPPTIEELIKQAQANRLAAYRAESDPLKVEAEYDAMLNGTEPDYTLWMAKVEEIKLRFPFPEDE